METYSFALKKTVIAGAAALTLIAAPMFMTSTFTTGVAHAGIISDANAAPDSGQGQKGAGAGGGQGQQGAGGQGGQGGKKGMDKVLEADEDSDRPPWAGGNTAENPHSGGGGGKPAGAGTMKGDDYGDLIVLLRDPITGEPILDGGQLQVCTTADCSVTVTMVDGEIPAGVTPIEVEFGRAAVARSPDKVTDKALTDALAKLTATGAVLSVDPAGRIVITVNGVSSTIDSPLENLALFVDLMTGLADTATTSQAEAALGSLATLDTAASLLAGVADKTGDISVDYVVYNNVIADIVAAGDYYNFASFSYTRTYPTDYSYYYTPDGGVTVLSATLDINAYLADPTVNGALPAAGGVTAFAAAADDALEVIELVHTQIHDGLLPGTL